MPIKRFPNAHATHPQWRMAAAMVIAQLRAQMALPDCADRPTLGLVYITDHYADEAQAILDCLCEELPEVTDWAGTVGVGVSASNVEYFDEPAMVVMLCDLGPEQYRVFNGVAPLSPGVRVDSADGFAAHTALVHADGTTPDLADLIHEMADRTGSGYLFGGLAGSRGPSVQFALGRSGHPSGRGTTGGVFHGGLSGIAFSRDVDLVSRVTQGAQPIAPEHEVTESDGHLVLRLDGEPALDVLLRELKISLDHPEHAMPRLRATLVGLTRPDPERTPPGSSDMARLRGAFGTEVIVRHLIGLDPARRGVAIADLAPVGTRLAFCERHVQAARADLMRVCAEVREELEPEQVLMGAGDEEPDTPPRSPRTIVGAIYVSCADRGGPHFGGPSAELQIVRHALGDVPLAGFFAGGEIAHHRLYGYTGVLTVFTRPA